MPIDFSWDEASSRRMTLAPRIVNRSPCLPIPIEELLPRKSQIKPPNSHPLPPGKDALVL